MSGDDAGIDPIQPFDPFDDDTCWVVQVDDEHMSLLPPRAALEALIDGLQRFATSPHPGLALAVDENGRARGLSPDELAEVCRTCAHTLTHFLRRGGMGDDALEAVAEAAATLRAIGEFDLELRFRDNDETAADRAMWVDALGRVAADCASMLRARFRPRRDGTFTLRWRSGDREILAEGVDELRRLLTSDDPAIARLFPPPYGDDEERNAGWNVLARAELIERRIEALDTVARLMDDRRASAEELSALMRTVNDVRLVFGTRLDVTEDGPPPDMSESERRLWLVYEFLGEIVWEAVRALRSTL